MINARSETAATKPTFRRALEGSRFLIPTNELYECSLEGEPKRPFLFRRDDHAPFALAGISEFFKCEGRVAQACAVLTTSASRFMERLHTRMPVILPPAAWESWLDRSITDAAVVAEWLRPAPADELVAVRVSQRVNSQRNNWAECVEAVGAIVR
jgi:putative SOS response-associated peptidase YedK